jgi:ribosomal protein L40E
VRAATVQALRRERAEHAAKLAAIDVLLAMADPEPDLGLEVVAPAPAVFVAEVADGPPFDPPPAPPAETKVCVRCGSEKPRVDFLIRASSDDGISAHCRACHGREGRPRRREAAF